ncbi:MAG: DUF2188 domain-containing protein [Ignavibacteriales bacterium]|nr:DUF2188 domain-containing protein [Ignavibacterium sp.]MCZ2268084.1 DUF2188 domain-containing protein [Ignavibacteriales bacterium]
MKNFHLTKSTNGWSLKKEGASRPLKTFETNKEIAIKKSAQILKQSNEASSLKIHKENGRIQEERTYPGSADPKKSKG